MQKTITSRPYQSLLAWLKNARNEQGLTMRELGAMIDEPHSFIGKIETGERRLDIAEYVQLCKALSLDPAEGLKFFKKP